MRKGTLVTRAIVGTMVNAPPATLNECERVIERGLSSFVDVGNALRSIKQDQLYEGVYDTFETYCRERWGMGHSFASYQMKGAKVVSTIVEVSQQPGRDEPVVPANEAQARELVPLLSTPADLNEVWERSLAQHGDQPTAKDIKEVRESWMGKTKKELVTAFSESERTLHKQLVSGETIVLSYHQHQNLIDWADLSDLLVRIDRKSVWGNPFILNDDGDRNAVIKSYEKYYLPHKPSLLSKIGELKGKALACWCAPEPCHGDILKNEVEAA